MGCITVICKNFFGLFNGLVIFTGLAITGLSIYFAIKQGQDGIFGSYSKWAIWAPFTMGLLISIFACCACGMRWRDDKRMILFFYSFLLFSFGGVILLSSVAQVVGIGYQLDISDTSNLKDLSGGLFGARKKLSDYDLGIYNLCCMKNETALFTACSDSGPQLCYHDEYYYNMALHESDEFCTRVEDLHVCPQSLYLENVTVFNEQLYTYAKSTFLNAAYALGVFGGILLITCFGACQTGKRNGVEDRLANR